MLSALWFDLNLKVLFKLDFKTGEPATCSPPGRQQPCVVCLSPVALRFRFNFFGRCQRCCRPSCAAKPGPGSGLYPALLCWGVSGTAQLLSCSTLWSCSCFFHYAQLFQKVQSEIGVSLAKSFADSAAVNIISEN